jgi:hypothetical protein
VYIAEYVQCSVYSHSPLLCTFVLSTGMFYNVPDLTHLLSNYLLLIHSSVFILQLLTEQLICLPEFLNVSVVKGIQER